MLIHGRLLLTSNGMMLDEVRSLLQKALRRNERELAMQATKELLGYGKDQLPWKSLVTFLFEDHCLVDTAVLRTFVELYDQGNKYKIVELLMQCPTSRIAACMPVIALTEEYDPVNWDADIQPDPSLQNLVTLQEGRLNFELVLLHLKKAWIEENHTELITYMKLASMVCDYDHPHTTRKGEDYLIRRSKITVKNSGFALIVLSMLHKNSTDIQMKQYLSYCYRIATILDVPIRLVLFAPVAQMIFRDKVQKVKHSVGSLDWKTVEVLSKMPDWATDKHTYRGKYGKATMPLLTKKKMVPKMTEDALEVFHGGRPKRDIMHFFREGAHVVNEVTPNPYWDRIPEIYLSQPKRQQKTLQMTKVYYEEITQKFPKLKYVSIKETLDDSKEGENNVNKNSSELRVPAISTRMTTEKQREKHRSDASAEKQGVKKRKGSELDEEDIPLNKLIKEAKSDIEVNADIKEKSDVQEKSDIQKSESGSSNQKIDIKLKGPLLQLPTGSAKVYSCLELKTKTVWKGPYRANKWNLTVFYHKVMRKVLLDPHTLKIQAVKPYITFPLLGKQNDIKINERPFYDAISKKQVEKGQFIERSDLEIIQLHRIALEQYIKLPPTIWVHFIYRFALNVGDSGLYNALTDRDFSFVFGIDMEENRHRVQGQTILDYMFTKRPAKAVCTELKKTIKKHKDEIYSALERQIDTESIVKLAKKYTIEFNKEQFLRRMEVAKSCVKNM